MPNYDFLPELPQLPFLPPKNADGTPKSPLRTQFKGSAIINESTSQHFTCSLLPDSFPQLAFNRIPVW